MTARTFVDAAMLENPRQAVGSKCAIHQRVDSVHSLENRCRGKVAPEKSWGVARDKFFQFGHGKSRFPRENVGRSAALSSPSPWSRNRARGRSAHVGSRSPTRSASLASHGGARQPPVKVTQSPTRSASASARLAALIRFPFQRSRRRAAARDGRIEEEGEAADQRPKQDNYTELDVAFDEHLSV
ncbi:hypothetical protein HPB50_011553 [Hyalomma asiaticum]|uniref:Uncharacterized protein n=1 Tax=Hyalomma asiaticum TaxID=266040 RepID=A0ACB7SE72_HYAAI|nr:hypothetical protein HPB50_011553 [Hyalomma asiaticum]